MTADHEVLLPPDDPAVFESLCLDLFRDVWGPESGAQKNGRRGQAQDGVDLYGRTADVWVGVQCKQKGGLLRTRVTVGELEEAVTAARRFKPKLARFILATTGPRDAKLQQRARELTRDGFAMEVWSWEEIRHELGRRRELFERLFPQYWPGQAGVRRRRVRPSKLRHAAEVLFGREEALAEFDRWWADEATHVVVLVAWGGVGKTSLVARWAAGLAARDFEGADYVDVSFYSQGTREKGAASADLFLDEALRFFGDMEMAESARSPWDKGARLAELVAERRTLLVLDGLEPLQHPPGPLSGKLQDQGVAALLRGLANRNPGLCVVTTRVPVVDLAAFEGKTVLQKDLEDLSTEAGVALLEHLGVQGLRAELEALAEEVRGHALTLDILGRYLKGAHGGDVRRRDRVRFEKADAEVQGGHAFRVMEAYERWFASEGERGQRLMAVLRLLGLFDRPAEAGCLEALRRPPAIPGLTESLVGLSEPDWNLAVSRLADHGLLSEDGGTLDAHPLVREHFGRRLRDEQPDAWKAGHGRLFEHLKDTTEHWPDTLDGLQPLYQAVFHGGQAGRQREAFHEVYWGRIHQNGRDGGFFSTRKLGAFGVDLRAVACFFEEPWSRVLPSLPVSDQAWLLSVAAYELSALGRLLEAVDPTRAALLIYVDHQDWDSAANEADGLSRLQLAIGEVPAALRGAKSASDLAGRTGNGFQEVRSSATLADVLHQTGRPKESLALFRQAEKRQAELQPSYPRLYGLRGFQYCDLLLADAEQAAAGGQDASADLDTCLRVVHRALQTLYWIIDDG
ncbi:MAG TPA: hypothetical protein VLF66_11765, partial [Thermoanaerobaculia bacterium]|nr:hypothetical protein [Thermoanaerobaculia bacterium]